MQLTTENGLAFNSDRVVDMGRSWRRFSGSESCHTAVKKSKARKYSHILEFNFSYSPPHVHLMMSICITACDELYQAISSYGSLVLVGAETGNGEDGSL